MERQPCTYDFQRRIKRPRISSCKNSCDSETYEKKRSKKQGTVQTGYYVHLSATDVRNHHIESYFPDSEFRDCPMNRNIGEELQGDSVDGILKDLLNDLESKKFPKLTLEDFKELVAASTPKINAEYIKTAILQPMTRILQSVDFRYDTAKHMVDSVKKLAAAIVKDDWLAQSNAKRREEHPFVAELERFLFGLLEGTSDPQRDLIQFLKQILQHYTTRDEETGLVCKLRTNGSGPPLQVTMRNDVVRDGATSTGNTHQDPAIPETYVITTLPDMLFEISKHPTVPTNKTKSAVSKDPLLPWMLQPGSVVFRPLSVQVMASPDQVRVSKDSGSGTKSDSSLSKTSDEDNIRLPTSHSCNSTDGNDTTQQLESLKTQHFIQLLSMMKSGQSRSPQQVHAIGIYVVMNRVYVTGITINDDDNEDSPTFLSKLMFKQTEIEPKEQDLHYSMYCSKFFNMFDAIHFGALLEFLKFLMFCQHEMKEQF